MLVVGGAWADWAKPVRQAPSSHMLECFRREHGHQLRVRATLQPTLPLFVTPTPKSTFLKMRAIQAVSAGARSIMALSALDTCSLKLH